MSAVIDSPVMRELAAILEDIDPFPNPNDSDFERCRGFKENDNIGRCRIRLTEDQNQIDSLLSQFQNMTKCANTKSLHDKMQTFITLTHCKKYHRDGVLEAFDRWKTQRKAALKNSRPVTPSRSATSHNDSFKPDSDTNYDESILDSHIADKMKNLRIDTPTSSRIGDKDTEKVESRREIFEMLGDVHFPKKGKEYKHGKIYQAIEEPLSEKSQAGILYVLEHTEISGLFKIGRSKFPVDVRHSQNCYKIETKPCHTTDKPFFGHARAEKIAHTILKHKRLLIVECLHCENLHQEWFLAPKHEVLSVVKLAERWLKMPAYEKQDGVYKLTPQALNILREMHQFSEKKMNSLMEEVYRSNDASRAFFDATSQAAARETGASAERAKPRILVNGSPDTTPPQRNKTRAKSPAVRTGGKGGRPFMETEETFVMHQRRSRETTPDGDGNYTYLNELEITRTTRTKVSISDFKQGKGVYDYSKPVVFDPDGQKEGGTEIKVREVQQA